MAGDSFSDGGFHQRLQSRVQVFLEKQHYDSALYWAEKLVVLSKGELRDVFEFVRCLYLTGQYMRAVHAIKSRQLEKKYAPFRYYLARCLHASGEEHAALAVLEGGAVLPYSLGQTHSSSRRLSSTHPATPHIASPSHPIPGLTIQNLESSMELLRGEIYEAVEDRESAAACFRRALLADVFCCEAFDKLTRYHVLSANDEKELLELLPVKGLSESEQRMLRSLYGFKVTKHSVSSREDDESMLGEEGSGPELRSLLEGSSDVCVARAERCYYNCQYREALLLCSQVMSRDLYQEQVLPLYVAVLTMLKNTNELFFLAHKLKDMYPSRAVSWFAVGCYYLLVSRYEDARRYLGKATTLEPTFGPAWLAFGHAFARDSEHDQATAAYFRAAEIMRGNHVPLVYLGVEYLQTSNKAVARQFLEEASRLAPTDPFLLHELATTAFTQHSKASDLGVARDRLMQAVDQLELARADLSLPVWEPIFNNLGHVCRKLGDLEASVTWHERALQLAPHEASTHTALGFTLALQNNMAEAITHFHRALHLRRKDVVAQTMLDKCVEALANSPSFLDDLPAPEITGTPHADVQKHVVTLAESDSLVIEEVDMCDT